MNNYLIYVNGVLVSPDIFDVVTNNSAADGYIAQATCRSDAKFVGKEIASVDVFEYRAGSCVRRYRYEQATSKAEHRLVVKADENTAYERTRFRLMTIPNGF